MQISKYILKFLILSQIFLSISAFGVNSCVSLFKDINFTSVQIETFFGIESESADKFKEYLKDNPKISELMKDKNIRDYVLGYAKGLSIKELSPILFKIWKNSISTNTDPELKLLFTESDTNLFLGSLRESSIDEKKLISRLERMKYAFEKVIIRITSLPNTLKRVEKILTEELDPSILDERLFDFYGYLNLKIEKSRVRQWSSIEGGGFGDINLRQVVAMEPGEMAMALVLAAEVENDIGAYSVNTHRILEILSAPVSRYMGLYDEEIPEHINKFTTSSWRSEEQRHTSAYLKMALQILGFAPKLSIEFHPEDHLDPEKIFETILHIFARAGAEWNAVSSYAALGAHTQGSLYKMLSNIRQDEVKHLTIFSGFHKYLFGNNRSHRLIGIIKKSLHEFSEKGDSSFGDTFLKVAVELIYSHFLTEKMINSYYKDVPLKTLRKIYETEIHLKKPNIIRSEEEENRIKKLQEKAFIENRNLSRWQTKEREFYLKLEKFEDEKNELIKSLIVERFSSFKGAELYKSESYFDLLKQFDNLTRWDFKMNSNIELTPQELLLLKMSLKENLRDYQIMNNKGNRELNLSVEFKSAKEGFFVLKDEAFEKVKKVKELKNP